MAATCHLETISLPVATMGLDGRRRELQHHTVVEKILLILETGRKPSLPQKASNTSTALQATHSNQDPEASIANTVK